MGKREGLADSLGRGEVVHAVLDYLQSQLPLVFVLENVKGLASIQGGAVLKSLLNRLSLLGGGVYDVSHRVLNTEDHGLPQHRERIFIIGLSKAAQRTATSRNPGRCVRYKWPAPAPRKTTLQHVLDKRVAKTIPALGGSAKLRLDSALAKLARLGMDTTSKKELVVVDVRGSKPHYMVNRMPTITRTRGAAGGFLILGYKRFTTPRELFALQGFPAHALRLDGIGEGHQGMLAGQATTVHVLARILARALPAVGLARGLRDPCTGTIF
jgi:site-specific DNA-cytosine methylase